MTAPKVERRKYDEEIIIALTRVEEKLDMQASRLDKINGTVADYNQNKYKMDLACKEILENKEEHKNFVSTKVMITITVILGLLITTLNLIQYFKVA